MPGVITLRKSGQGGPEGVAPNSVLRVRNNSMADEVDLSEGIISDNGTVVTIAGDVNVTGSLIGSTSVVGANPTASIGLTTVNGSALTFMRSDAAPALDVSISPVWTGVHKYIGGAPITFDGATGGTFTTTLNITDPTADRLIAIPNLTGTIIVTTSSVPDTTNLPVGSGALLFTTGSSAILYFNDAGTMKSLTLGVPLV